MLTVACVLKTGGEYAVEHVRTLRDQVRQHLKTTHRFVCLTDGTIDDVETVPLVHGWPGWWSKIELFRPGAVQGPVLYLDLDTAVVGDITDIAEGHWFTVLRNFWRPDAIGSGLMAWQVTPTFVYDQFLEDPDDFMKSYVVAGRYGDQGFIQDAISPVDMRYWQDVHPGRVVSYRAHVRPRHFRPTKASIVCFGGQFRPWNTTDWHQVGDRP